MIVTHNYYIDFLKSFNAFLSKRFLSPEVTALSSQPIQKIEYNISSKTITTYQLYGNESFEYPNIIIDLLDIRADEGISSISRNAYGLIPSLSTFELTYNETKNESILLEVKRYFLNFNIRVNLESSGDLINYYHIISNNVPFNFTFIDYKFNYFIDISNIFNNLNWHEDDNIINLIKDNRSINTDETSSYHYYSLFETQPEFEFTSITKEEDKENMKYAININCVAAINIPYILYTRSNIRIDRIIISTDLNSYNETPILLDMDAKIFQNNNIIKSELISNNDITKVTEIVNEGTPSEFKKDTYQISTNFDLTKILKEDVTKYRIGMYLISNYFDINQKRLYLPIDKFQIVNSNQILIDIDENDQIKNIDSFLEQYNNLSMIILNIFEAN